MSCKAASRSGRRRRCRVFLLTHRQAGRTRFAGLELHEQVDHVIQSSGLIEHFKKEKGERGEGRVENLLELVSAARGFSPGGARPTPAARILSRPRRAGVGRGPGRSLRRLRANDDPAFGQGSGVPRGVSRRHGRRLVSAPALGCRSRGARGGTPALLRRRDARHAAALTSPMPSSAGCTAWTNYGTALALHQRVAGRAGRGNPAAPAGVATGLRQTRRASKRLPRLRHAAWAAGSGTRNSATAWC